MNRYQWLDFGRIVFLSAALRGEAQRILHGMSDSGCNDYSKLVARLELHFGVEKQAELFQAKLHNRRQQDGESLKALSADVRSMSSLAYQDLAPSAQECFAVQHFIDAVSDVDHRMRLRRDKPRTLDEALLTACELEAFRMMDTGLPSLKPQLRSVENITKESACTAGGETDATNSSSGAAIPCPTRHHTQSYRSGAEMCECSKTAPVPAVLETI